MSWLEQFVGTDTIFPNRHGDFKVLKTFKIPYINSYGKQVMKQIVTIRFITPNSYVGYTFKDVVSSSIRKPPLISNIRDPYQYDMANGGGCLGFFHPAFGPASSCKEYEVWRAMIRRCYDPNVKAYKDYGAKGVTVSKDWRCYEIFLYQLPYVPGYEEWKRFPSEYSIDKDARQKDVPTNQKIYSVDTVCFIPNRFNTIDRNNRKNYPDGYIGVVPKRGAYLTMFRHKCLGKFITAEAAACRYNYERLKFDPDAPWYLLNDVPMIPYEDLILNFKVND